MFTRNLRGEAARVDRVSPSGECHVGEAVSSHAACTQSLGVLVDEVDRRQSVSTALECGPAVISAAV